MNTMFWRVFSVAALLLVVLVALLVGFRATQHDTKPIHRPPTCGGYGQAPC